MRNMSFAMTTQQIQAGTKTVTRRFGWWFLKPGDLVRPVRKAMGLKKGEKIEPLRAPIRILSVRAEPLIDMEQADCAREGYPEMSAFDFVYKLADHYKCNATDIVNRIEFEYTDEPAHQDAPAACEYCRCDPCGCDENKHDPMRAG